MRRRREGLAGHNPHPGDAWLWGAALNLLLCLAFLLFFVAVAWLSAGIARAEGWHWQWPVELDDAPPVARPAPEPGPQQAETNAPELRQRPLPPDVQPYQFPTYDGRQADFRIKAPELAPFPDIDTESLYQVVVNCFPERVPWGVEIKAVAGARYTDQKNTVSTFDTAGLSKYYAGVVAEIPLFSASEINNERRAEYQRRTQLSDNVAKLLQSLAAMRRAWREIGLYNRATLRSQERVKIGVADTSEQVGYVEKVALAYSKLDDARAAADGARLALYGQCRDEEADRVNHYLKAVVDDFVKRAKVNEMD